MHFSLRSNPRSRSDKEKDPDVSPLIDMVFILLIFFIVTTVFVDEVGMEVMVPGMETVESTEPAESIRLLVAANGKILHEQTELTLAEVADLVRGRHDDPVLVEVENDALSGRMVQVLDAARTGGAHRLSVTRTR